jgi:hypothetical protein
VSRSSFASAALIVLLPSLAAAGRPPFSWAAIEVPKTRAVIPVHGKLEAAGVPVRAMQVVSDEKPDELARYFIKLFKDAGLYLPPSSHQVLVKDALQLTALDVERLHSFTVVIAPNPDGTCSVTLGEAALNARRPAGGTFAPVMPDAVEMVNVDVEAARSMSYQTRASAEAIGAFYRETLGKAGYTEISAGVFRNSERELSVVTRDLDERTRVVLVKARTRPAAAK